MSSRARVGDQSSRRDTSRDSDEDKETEMTLKKQHVTLGDLEIPTVEICCKKLTMQHFVISYAAHNSLGYVNLMINSKYSKEVTLSCCLVLQKCNENKIRKGKDQLKVISYAGKQ